MKPAYKQMLERMEKKEELISDVKTNSDIWFLYVLQCKDGSYYTGITKDLKRRLKQHNLGTASKYTRTRLPVEMIYDEICGTRTQALIRECHVKGFSREKKEQLVKIKK